MRHCAESAIDPQNFQTENFLWGGAGQQVS